MQNANKFLKIYSELEQHLRSKYNYKDEISFSKVLRETSQKNGIIKNYYNELKTYHNLRNTIVHNRPDGQPIAEPYSKVVERFSKIVEKIQDPPKVYPKFSNEVLTLSAHDPISKAVTKMYNNSFSQIPIIDKKGAFQDLLTANTISRWLGANVEIGMVDMEDDKISDVLEHKEELETYRFIKRDDNLADVIDIFSRSNQEESQINAILITHHGKKKSN